MQVEGPAKVGRPPERREGLVNALRERIVSGYLKPGDRLPTHHELEESFQAGPPAIQAAMAVLREHGFIETKHRCGTFVARHPPHLSHFALTFPFPYVRGLSRLYEALSNEAAKIQAPERRVSTFYGIAAHVDVEDYQRLLGFVRAHRLGGLIFAGNPFELLKAGSPLACEPGVLRTAIMVPDVSISYPTVYPDLEAFLPKAFEHLASHGRKRVAVVMLGGSRNVDLSRVQSLAAARGLLVRPHWLQAAFADGPGWARQLALVLLHEGQAERPDAVVIMDDNLVEGFTAGIRDSGARVGVNGGGDLEVVAQANFPYPTPSAVPARRLGYNITELLAVCLERIEQQRRGETPPAHTAIPAVWENER